MVPKAKSHNDLTKSSGHHSDVDRFLVFFHQLDDCINSNAHWQYLIKLMAWSIYAVVIGYKVM
ncbi:hypothetical protein B0189_02765 [Moraxella cuniculi]|nr:hypothetical protein B0189_02765 [Moraxella cuniculi]